MHLYYFLFFFASHRSCSMRKLFYSRRPRPWNVSLAILSLTTADTSLSYPLVSANFKFRFCYLSPNSETSQENRTPLQIASLVRLMRFNEQLDRAYETSFLNVFPKSFFLQFISGHIEIRGFYVVMKMADVSSSEIENERNWIFTIWIWNKIFYRYFSFFHGKKVFFHNYRFCRSIFSFSINFYTRVTEIWSNLKSDWFHWSTWFHSQVELIRRVSLKIASLMRQFVSAFHMLPLSDSHVRSKKSSK